jgi:hypothetical protein
MRYLRPRLRVCPSPTRLVTGVLAPVAVCCALSAATALAGPPPAGLNLSKALPPSSVSPESAPPPPPDPALGISHMDGAAPPLTGTLDLRRARGRLKVDFLCRKYAHIRSSVAVRIKVGKLSYRPKPRQYDGYYSHCWHTFPLSAAITRALRHPGGRVAATITWHYAAADQRVLRRKHLQPNVTRRLPLRGVGPARSSVAEAHAADLVFQSGESDCVGFGPQAPFVVVSPPYPTQFIPPPRGQMDFYWQPALIVWDGNHNRLIGPFYGKDNFGNDWNVSQITRDEIDDGLANFKTGSEGWNIPKGSNWYTMTVVSTYYRLPDGILRFGTKAYMRQDSWWINMVGSWCHFP